MQVITAKMSSKNQIVVPTPVRQALSLNPGDMIIWHVQAKEVKLTPGKPNWTTYTSGLGKHAWKGKNIKTYVNQLRTEWDR